MSTEAWSWLLTAVGLTGFILAGRKVWWAWYINLGCQALWMAYALLTRQYGFVVASLVYSVVFTQNAVKWTKEHRAAEATPSQVGPGAPEPHSGKSDAAERHGPGLCAQIVHIDPAEWLAAAYPIDEEPDVWNEAPDYPATQWPSEGERG